MTWALIARGDRGGLAAQTIELHRHLLPDKTLVMDLGRSGRGPCSLGQFTHGQIRVNPGPAMSDASMTWLLDDTDVVLTVEADYRPDLWDIAHTRSVRTVLIANPELYRPYMQATRIICPTPWELDRMPPGTAHVPFPVARDRLPYRRRTSASTFLHVAAPAMGDRNGTELLFEALGHVRTPCHLLVRGIPRRHLPRKPGVVQVDTLVDDHENYWTAYPDDVDVLVMPRRYGGLSLPVQECASLGIPSIMTGIAPQSGWPGVLRVDAIPERSMPMKGGAFPLYGCDPRSLARAMDNLTTFLAVDSLSDAAGQWADELDWARWSAGYRAIIDTAGARTR